MILFHITLTRIKRTFSFFTLKLTCFCWINKIPVSFLPYIFLLGRNYNSRNLLCLLNRIPCFVIDSRQFSHAVNIIFFFFLFPFQLNRQRFFARLIYRFFILFLFLFHSVRKCKTHLFSCVFRYICFKNNLRLFTFLIVRNIFLLCGIICFSVFYNAVKSQQIPVDEHIRRINTLFCEIILRSFFILRVSDLHFVHRCDLFAWYRDPCIGRIYLSIYKISVDKPKRAQVFPIFRFDRIILSAL